KSQAFIADYGNAYLRGHREFGCCGVPETAVDSDLFLVDTTFKLLISKDELVSDHRLQRLQKAWNHLVFR
ncbi:hypothetical protein NPIL_272451, partial [Nephila pilipes]